ncbi:MAG: acireductone synthase [Gemmatimonadaceae bacterium]|nr:acireductone synthase [Acetobacteraceae bacterium]
MIPPAAVLIDVEGTTTPIRFVHDVLFPYARARLPDLLAHRAHDPDVAAALADVPGPDRLATLLAWMDADAKATPLKALQGILWRDGYATGALQGELYPDVAPGLRRWAAAGLRLCVYSSGSVDAQRQLFGHSVAGDLVPLFQGFFDTAVGPKRDAASYATIVRGLFLPGAEVLFLSDIEAELDAAATAGLRTCQVVRAADATVPSDRHPTAPDFAAVARQFAMPAA